jgi:hypothetical protein
MDFAHACPFQRQIETADAREQGSLSVKPDDAASASAAAVDGSAAGRQAKAKCPRVQTSAAEQIEEFRLQRATTLKTMSG